jgi:hypothetical protein
MSYPPWTIPWNIMLPSVVGLCVIVAVLAWLIGRAWLRGTFNREVDVEARRDAEVARLTERNEWLESDNERLHAEISELRQTLKAISSLAVRPVGEGPLVRLIRGELEEVQDGKG